MTIRELRTTGHWPTLVSGFALATLLLYVQGAWQTWAQAEPEGVG